MKLTAAKLTYVTPNYNCVKILFNCIGRRAGGGGEIWAVSLFCPPHWPPMKLIFSYIVN